MNFSLKNACLALSLCASTMACADSGQASTGRFSALTSFFSGLKLPSSASCSQGFSSLFTSARSKYNEPINSESGNKYYTKGNVVVGGSLFLGITSLIGWQVWSYRKKSQDKPKFQRQEPVSLHTWPVVIPRQTDPHMTPPSAHPATTNIPDPVAVLQSPMPSSSRSDLPLSSPVVKPVSKAAVPAAELNQYGLTPGQVKENLAQVWSHQNSIEDAIGKYGNNASQVLAYAKQVPNAFSPENLAKIKSGEITIQR